MIGEINTFQSRAALAEKLADEIMDWCVAPGQLELSGGSTPHELLSVLGSLDLPSNLMILPVDDRCVSHDSIYSNYGMFRSALTGRNLLPLFDEQLGVQGSTENLNSGLAEGRRFTILGLGPDGHTASLFPNSPDLAKGLDPCSPAFIASHPTMEPLVPRITMTASHILAADRLVLHFHGTSKWKLFEQAQVSDPLLHPISHFLRHPAKEVDVFYAP